MAEAKQKGITPLEHMLAVVRAPLPVKEDNETDAAYSARCKWHISRQDAMAVAASPYLHPRLSAVEHKQDPDQFAKEQQAKVENMDVMEIARRIAFVFAESQRLKDLSEGESHGESRHH